MPQALFKELFGADIIKYFKFVANQKNRKQSGQLKRI